MNNTEEFLSQSKYAEHRKVTKGYIGRLVKEGRLHLIKGKLNVEMSDAELDNKSNNDKAPNYWSEKALHEKAKWYEEGFVEDKVEWAEEWSPEDTSLDINWLAEVVEPSAL